MKKFGFSARAAIVCSLILAIGVPSVAMGFGEGRSLLLGKRNPSSNANLALTTETEIIASNSTDAPRQSNKKDGDGGGAIYGCRSNPGNEPCIRANNLKGGRAFEFDTVGKEAGRIQVGDTTGAPLTTNATGVATGLNSDKVDGKDATDFAGSGDLRFAVVAADGTATGRGVASGARAAATNTYTVTFDKDVSKCSFTATPNVTDATAAVFLGVSASTSDPKAVVVDEENPPAAGTPFHLQVIC